jgi:hypothetical protein
MVAAMFLGMKTVSFLSPKRYIVEPLVFSTRAADSLAYAFSSALDLRAGALAYIPSWNFCPSVEGPRLEMVPHDENMTAAANASGKIFFILFFFLFIK